MNGLRVFSTSPASNLVAGDYRNAARDAARWSERAGCDGILVYTDNGLLDPWLVAREILDVTTTLAPLVAIQPVYMHPYTVAKMVATIWSLHRRRVCLNMVAGGFTNDLRALDDNTPHDRRYDRVVEYASVLMQLLQGDTVTMEGEFYRVKNLRLTPGVPPGFAPLITVSGSSEAGIRAAKRLGAIAIEYPRPAAQYSGPSGVEHDERGIRIGIIARADAAEAWRVARERFPEDRKGRITHELAMKTSDSHWHRQLAESRAAARRADDPYWLVPFENYKTFCPYLVGDYPTVSAELARYLRAGFRTIILDVPGSPEEMEHIGVTLRAATATAGV